MGAVFDSLVDARWQQSRESLQYCIFKLWLVEGNLSTILSVESSNIVQ